MFSADSNVTLDVVRMTAENLTNQFNVQVTEISAEKVLEKLGRGSKGCIAAYLRQVKLEKIRAEKFELLDLPSELKSVLFALVSTHAQKAEDLARAEAKITEEEFRTIHLENLGLTASLEVVESEFTQHREQSILTIQHLEKDLSEARGRLASTEELKKTLQEAKTFAEEALRAAQLENQELHRHISELKALSDSDRLAYQSAQKSLSEKLAESDKERAVESQRTLSMGHTISNLEQKLHTQEQLVLAAEKSRTKLQETCDSLRAEHNAVLIRATTAEAILNERHARGRESNFGKKKKTTTKGVESTPESPRKSP